MDIAEFVKTTLTQIIKIISGVKEAQKDTKLQEGGEEDADMINPPVMYSADSGPKGKYYATVHRNIVHMVDFDIAITADSSSDAGGKLSLKVAGVGGIEGGGGSVNRDSIVSRVKFQIPITLPLPSQIQ